MVGVACHGEVLKTMFNNNDTSYFPRIRMSGLGTGDDACAAEEEVLNKK